MRIRSFAVFAVFLFSVLWLRLFHLEVVSGRHYRNLSQQNCIRLLPQPGNRGRILDRHGAVIADSSLSYDVLLIPSFARPGLEKNTAAEREKVFARLAEMLGVALESLKNTYEKNYARSFAPALVAANIERKLAMVIEESKSELPGVIIQAHPQRRYPSGRLAAHLLGYLNEIDRWRLTRLADYGYKIRDTMGFGGIEERYDYYLRQEEGGMSVEVDHRQRFVRVVAFRPAENGRDIQLTLDLKIQQIVEEAMAQRTGSALVMKPFTGEILALVSSPGFNPSLFVKKQNAGLNALFRHPDAPLVNRAISAVFPAGSIFKLVVATAGLETGRINLGTSFVCPGKMHLGLAEFLCRHTHGNQSLIPAIAHSCNIFFYHSGLLVGPELIHDYALKLGFAHPTGIDLPYESRGFIPSPFWRKIYKRQPWFLGDTLNFAIGQGEVLVTPLQVARMMAFFANQGKLVRPYLVKKIADVEIEPGQRKIKTLPIKEATLNAIRQGLREVVSRSDGTASILAELTVAVAGKTGTAQASPGPAHGWFAGFFPYRQPKYVVCVFLERGEAGYYATLVAKEIIQRIITEGL